MAPFAIVPDRIARLVWFALSFGLLCAFVRWSIQTVPERRLRVGILMAFAFFLGGRFYARELNLGQTNILLGFTLTGALLAAEAGAARLAGGLVGLAVFIKPYALILVPWVWLAAGLPGLTAMAAVFGVGLLLPALAYGWTGNLDQVRGWYRTVTDTNAPNLLVVENISFNTAWAKWIGVGPAAARLAMACDILVLGLAAWVMTMRRRVREPAYLEFGFLMLLIPLISPQGWDYVLLLATPVIMLVVDRWRDMALFVRPIAAIALAAFGFTVFDIIRRTAYVFAMEKSLTTIVVLTLAGCLIYLRWRKLA